MADNLTLTVDGVEYGGWTSVSVEIGIDSLAHSFDIAVASRSPEDGSGEAPAPWLARAGAAVTVAIDGEPLITGFIDEVEPTLGPEEHAITIRGRARAADLIDCSAVHATGHFIGRTLLQIATMLAQPFAVSVQSTAAAANTVFPTFALQPGETVFEAIERAAKMRGLLIVSTATGDIALITPEPRGPAVRIREGHEIERLTSRHSVAERFSRYIVRGQSAGSDELNGRAASQVRAEARDAGVKRARPLIIVAEDQASIASAQARANWEATVRAARSQSAEVTLAGWRNPAGALWQPMQLVELIAPAGFVEGAMMAANIRFALDESGRSTVLTLAYPEAYRPEPIAPSADAARIRGKGR